MLQKWMNRIRFGMLGTIHIISRSSLLKALLVKKLKKSGMVCFIQLLNCVSIIHYMVSETKKQKCKAIELMMMIYIKRITAINVFGSLKYE